MSAEKQPQTRGEPRTPRGGSAGARPGARPYVVALLGLALGLFGSPTELATPALGPSAAAAQEPPVDTASLASGPFAEVETRFDRRFLFLRFDVLTVRVRFGPATAERLRGLAEGQQRTASRADSAARIAGRATDAFAEIEFLRGIRLDQFVDATRDNLRRAADAGFISERSAREIGEDLPEWFAFLRERGLREGDRLLYRIRGDSLRTVYLDPRGDPLLDQTDVGPERRLAVLGGYFAPGADFRDGLLDALFSED